MLHSSTTGMMNHGRVGQRTKQTPTKRDVKRRRDDAAAAAASNARATQPASAFPKVGEHHSTVQEVSVGDVIQQDERTGAVTPQAQANSSWHAKLECDSSWKFTRNATDVLQSPENQPFGVDSGAETTIPSPGSCADMPQITWGGQGLIDLPADCNELPLTVHHGGEGGVHSGVKRNRLTWKRGSLNDTFSELELPVEQEGKIDERPMCARMSPEHHVPALMDEDQQSPPPLQERGVASAANSAPVPPLMTCPDDVTRMEGELSERWRCRTLVPEFSASTSRREDRHLPAPVKERGVGSPLMSYPADDVTWMEGEIGETPLVPEPSVPAAEHEDQYLPDSGVVSAADSDLPALVTYPGGGSSRKEKIKDVHMAKRESIEAERKGAAAKHKETRRNEAEAKDEEIRKKDKKIRRLEKEKFKDVRVARRESMEAERKEAKTKDKETRRNEAAAKDEEGQKKDKKIRRSEEEKFKDVRTSRRESIEAERKEAEAKDKETRRNEAAAMDEQIRRKDKKIRRLEEEKFKDGRLARRESIEVERKEAEAKDQDTRRNEVAAKDEEIRNKDEKIRRLEEEAAAKDEEMKLLKSQQCKTILIMRAEIEEKHKGLETSERQHRRQLGTVEILKSDVRERDERVEGLERELMEKNLQMGDWWAEHQGKAEEVTKLIAELAGLEECVDLILEAKIGEVSTHIEKLRKIRDRKLSQIEPPSQHCSRPSDKYS